MTAINPINVNTTGISNGFVYGQGAKSANKEKETEQKVVNNHKQSSINPEDVLSYMANSANGVVGAANAKGASSINPSDYLDDEAQARIAGYVAGFESKVTTGLQAVDKELPKMSNGAKMA